MVACRETGREARGSVSQDVSGQRGGSNRTRQGGEGGTGKGAEGRLWGKGERILHPLKIWHPVQLHLLHTTHYATARACPLQHNKMLAL